MRSYFETENGKLYCGDCLSILPQLEPVDLIVTDPPYGIGFSKYVSHTDDKEQYPEFMSKVVSLLNNLLKPGGYSFVFQAMKNTAKWHKIFPFEYRIFCAARNFTQFLPTPIQYSWDPVIFWNNGKSKIPPVSGNRDYHTGNTAKYITQKSNGHPCPRPIDTILYIVTIASKVGYVTLDCFLGSGTTAVACERLNRKWIGIEISEKYCEIAAKRIEKETRQRKLFK